jgi:hypothetical protein
MMRAYRTTAHGIESVVAAPSPAMAKRMTMRSANDAGYRVRWIEVRCRRDPEFDGWAGLHGFPSSPRDPELIRREISATKPRSAAP